MSNARFSSFCATAYFDTKAGALMAISLTSVVDVVYMDVPDVVLSCDRRRDMIQGLLMVIAFVAERPNVTYILTSGGPPVSIGEVTQVPEQGDTVVIMDGN